MRHGATGWYCSSGSAAGVLQRERQPPPLSAEDRQRHLFFLPLQDYSRLPPQPASPLLHSLHCMVKKPFLFTCLLSFFLHKHRHCLSLQRQEMSRDIYRSLPSAFTENMPAEQSEQSYTHTGERLCEQAVSIACAHHTSSEGYRWQHACMPHERGRKGRRHVELPPPHASSSSSSQPASCLWEKERQRVTCYIYSPPTKSLH